MKITRFAAECSRECPLKALRLHYKLCRNAQISNIGILVGIHFLDASMRASGLTFLVCHLPNRPVRLAILLRDSFAFQSTASDVRFRRA